MISPFLAMPQGAEWIVILVIVILVFGAAKLPDLARSTGQALRIFKSETKALKDDDEKDAPEGTTQRSSAELPSTTAEQTGVVRDESTDKHHG
ncbi:Sec-independent protein translocase subunit TatA [Nocardioides bruguierae]|uniref:Sec-independent protein translocase protein TatA n=1 Tax=Nocardioides bruguierae TaxID=2945102 RepID=A0A9X2D441_9ACTN|nr:Sec-independent protein translocase subunit TatA [Nocardioides bruguierae]MCL8025871.1 Sec-independent protein translocase subunit TatA [Nocardioides bruguierae]MCM0618986.1 Sec-independent protein translocase subunit TatA [Nocardioides bruguierae]